MKRTAASAHHAPPFSVNAKSKILVLTPLFSTSPLSAFLDNRRQRLRTELEWLHADQLLQTPTDHLIHPLVQKYTLKPITLAPDAQLVDAGITALDLTGDPRAARYRDPKNVQVRYSHIAIPFEGDDRLFTLTPGRSHSNPPRGEIRHGELHLTLYTLSEEPDALRAELERTITEIRQYITWSTEDLHPFNTSLPALATRLVDQRKRALLADATATAALGLPTRDPASGPVQTYAAPITRKELPITPRPGAPAANTVGAIVPEPVLAMEHYDHILHLIASVSEVMERHPQTFENAEEEIIRNHILVALNAQYAGHAVGETFSVNGRTDILIRYEGRMLFIGECKIWGGQQMLHPALDQLLGYTAWRDTKTALILLIRNRKISTVLDTLPDLLKTHPKFKRELTTKSTDLCRRYIFEQKDDPNRDLHLAIQLLHLPAPATKTPMPAPEPPTRPKPAKPATRRP